MKNLLKKYHPDQNSDKEKSKLFHEISIRLTAELNKLRSKEEFTAFTALIENGDASGKKIVEIEQDYALYKAGIVFYKRIHPSKFYKQSSIDSLFSGFVEHDYETQLKVFRDMLDCFYVSERYFKRLIADYPNSIWKNDAIEKIKYMNDLKSRYYKMKFNNL